MFPLYKRPCLFVTATLSKTKWSGAKLWYISSFKSRPSLYSTGMCSYKVIQGHLSGINDGTRLHNNIHVNIFWFGFTRPSELHPAFIWTPSGQEEWGVGSLSEYRHSPEIAGERASSLGKQPLHWDCNTDCPVATSQLCELLQLYLSQETHGGDMTGRRLSIQP